MDNDKFENDKPIIKCCICGCMINGYGNNPYPLNKNEGARCCDLCDSLVIRARIIEIYKNRY